MSADTGKALVAFATSHFLPSSRATGARGGAPGPPQSAWDAHECDIATCTLVQWTRQTHAVASKIREHSGERTSVHLFTPCLHPRIAAALSISDPTVPIIVHASHAAALRHAVHALQELAEREGCCKQWTSPSVWMLLRWEIFAMEHDARVIVYLDLDLEILPRWSALLVHSQGTGGDADRLRGRPTDSVVDATGREWHRLISCAARSRFALLSYPDHSSPVHGALLLARPNRSLFREGLELLRRTVRRGAFNATLGWDEVGEPRVAVPAADHVWYRRRGHTHIVDANDWGFVGGEVDQGLLFHMLRVRHQLGADLRLTHCVRTAVRGQPAGAVFFHYGSVGGKKPEEVVRQWHWVHSHALCGRARETRFFAENAEVLIRTLLWVRRTVAEIDSVRQTAGTAEPRDASWHYTSAQLDRCTAALHIGLGCLLEGHANDTIPLPGGERRNCPPSRCKPLSWGDLLERPPRSDESVDDVHGVHSRPIPLLASSDGIPGAYTTTPRWAKVRASTTSISKRRS